jgi:UDP-glucose-4-epimerase GalE
VSVDPKVLVTGGAGYVGSHCCKALASAGFVPVTYDNLVHGNRSAVQWGPFVEGDLSDRHRIAEAIRQHSIQAVLHFAAYAYVGESMQRPGEYFANNVTNTLNLLEAMRDTGRNVIVFSSTCATYGLPESLPIDESHAQQPVNPYGESKLFVERSLHWYGKAYSFRTAALRYFNAAGADPKGETGETHEPETHLIPIVIETALGLRPAVEIYGTDYPTPDGTAIRDYIHVSDLADAHVSALRHLLSGTAELRLNLGTGVGHSVREIIRTVAKSAGRNIATRESPRRPGDPPILVADASRAMRLLPWQPRHSGLQDIVETAWRWHERRAGAGSPELRSISW